MKDEIKSHFKGNHQTFYRKYLQKVSKIGGQEFKAVCPFHDDTDPSFNFSDTTGQYFCHGCNKKGDLFHFYGKVNGLDTRRDFGKILRGIADDFGIAVTKQKSRIVKTYSYIDEQGKELFQTCRKKPKDFTQRHRNGNGGWTYNIKGVRRVLYRLPDVLNANEVFIVEGEKDADNLSRIGFTATTSPMGAKKWRDEYNESLKGKKVILCPDNDNEGREHMTRVAQSLNGNAKSLKWLDLPDLPPKGDVSDYITGLKDKDDAAERLAILIDNAEPYNPGDSSSASNPMDAIINTCVERGYVAMLGDEQWLFENLIIKNQITVIIAKSGGGKTTICFDFVAPRIIKKHGVKVFFMDCDSPASDHKRMFKIAEQNGSSFYWVNPITQGKNADYLLEKLREMVRLNTRMDNVVFFMDTLKKFLNVMSKNSTKPFYELLRQMISLGATIGLLGHANKYRDNEGNLVFEGVGDILSDADALIYFESVKSIGGGDDVTTIVDRDKGAKVRGLYEPISFHIAGDDRVVTQHKNVVPVPDYSPRGRKERLSDDEIMDEVRNLLQNKTGRMNQSNIVDALKSKPGIPYNRLLDLLKSQVVADKPAVAPGTIYFFNGERGTKFYDVVE